MDFTTTVPARALLCRAATLLLLLLLFTANAAAQASLTIIEPNGGESFTAGVSTVSISWFEAGIEANDEIIVEFTVDGTTWRPIDRIGADVRSVAWVPDRAGSSARVRITSSDDPSVSDSSDGTFTIAPDPNDVARVIAPNGGEVWQSGETRTISWDAPSDAVGMVLALSTNGGTSWTPIDTVAAGSAEYSWTIPQLSSTPITTATIRVAVAEAPDRFDVSDAAFTINPRPRPTLTVIAPNGGERFDAGTSTTVRWSSENVDDGGAQARVEYSVDSGRTWTPIGTADVDAGARAWIIPNRPTRSALVRVVTSDVALGDTSDAVFEIVGEPVPPDSVKFIRLDEPADGATWRDGESQRIAWTSNAADDTVVVTAIVRVGSGADSSVAIARVAVADGSVTWVVPRFADSLVELRVVAHLAAADTADTSGPVIVRHRVVAGVDGDGASIASLRLYPNPAHELLEVRIATGAHGLVRLYAVDGTPIREARLDAGRASVPLDGMSAGTYMVVVETPAGRRTSHIVVVR
ncbi:MAG TPA: T9SS type A sorting domain-containing protein [Candidatus Kapabacteria bacterium]|jgi:hypothetical protein|nr:T9SS type A sorting domain-containing protein [Candidatus Kapabacteria bacterium]